MGFFTNLGITISPLIVAGCVLPVSGMTFTCAGLLAVAGSAIAALIKELEDEWEEVYVYVS